MPTTERSVAASTGRQALELASELITRRSVTPEDAGCQQLLIDQLRPLGFVVERLQYGGVTNLWARLGSARPLVVFAGHTDVVPPGDEGAWEYPPFQPVIREGMLCGRGAADMKASLAAMIVGTQRYLATCGSLRGSIGFLITSDEEGDAVDGTARVVEHLTRNHVHIDQCIVGEPSSQDRLGDTIRNGRRGSLNAQLRLHGVQGHVAYPELARNPIHDLGRVLMPLTSRRWDEGNAYFPPTSLQISNINAGTGATNVIPGTLDLKLNLRFSSEQTAEGLERSVEQMLHDANLNFDVTWTRSGQPFLTPRGRLTERVCNAVHRVMGFMPALSTSGGTSDGRFIAPTGAEVVELGPLNATIHKVNERVAVDDIERLVCIHEEVLRQLLDAPPTD